jgi:hypothetical protein
MLREAESAWTGGRKGRGLGSSIGPLKDHELALHRGAGVMEDKDKVGQEARVDVTCRLRQAKEGFLPQMEVTVECGEYGPGELRVTVEGGLVRVVGEHRETDQVGEEGHFILSASVEIMLAPGWEGGEETSL